MLTVCASSTDTDLTTTGFVKDLLGIVGTSQDQVLGALIKAASRWAENYVGRPLALQSYSETVPGYGRLQLMLKRYPVRSVDRVMEATDSGATELQSSEYTLEDADAGIITRPEGWNWTPLMEGHAFDAAVPLTLTPMSGQEERPFLVDYHAGYTYDGIDTGSPHWSTGGKNGSTSTGRTLPEDIELAVAYKVQGLLEGGEEVASESLGDISVNYRSLGNDSDGTLLTRSKELLNPYRGYA